MFCASLLMVGVYCCRENAFYQLPMLLIWGTIQLQLLPVSIMVCTQQKWINASQLLFACNHCESLAAMLSIWCCIKDVYEFIEYIFAMSIKWTSTNIDACQYDISIYHCCTLVARFVTFSCAILYLSCHLVVVMGCQNSVQFSCCNVTTWFFFVNCTLCEPICSHCPADFH